MSGLGKSPGLEQEAQQILLQLESTNVPPYGLDYFTVGDSFHNSLFTLKERIVALSLHPQALERVIIGGFGTGKTHYLSYLSWLLQRDAPEKCVISRVDTSDLRDPQEFEFLVVQGLRPIRGGENYAHVLRDAYKCVRDAYVAKYSGISQQDVEHAYATILFLILGHATQGWVSHEMVEILGMSDPLNRLINFFAGRTIQHLFEQARNNSNTEHVAFVDTYLEMIRRQDMPITAFETPARQLSHRGRLADVIFKVLALSGIRLVVLLTDELESLERFETPTVRQILVSIRDLRDSFSNVGCNPGYPSIAFIVTSTGPFFDKIHLEEPALHSRWEDKKIPLEFFSIADIDNLIFKLRELHYLAGYRLRPVAISQDGREHEVIQLRNRLVRDFNDPNRPLDMTARRLITGLIKDIRETWALTAPRAFPS